MKCHRKVKKIVDFDRKAKLEESISAAFISNTLILHHILLKNGPPSWLSLMDLLGLNNINLLPVSIPCGNQKLDGSDERPHHYALRPSTPVLLLPKYRQRSVLVHQTEKGCVRRRT